MPSEPAGPQRPESHAARYMRQLHQARALRIGALLLAAAGTVAPHLPSQLLGIPWRQALSLDLVLPAVPLVLGPLGVPPQPLGQWLAWALAAFLGLVASSLALHLGSLFAQRTRPATSAPSIYLRLALPLSAAQKPADTAALLKALHGVAAPVNPLQPTPAPLQLSWSARPERKIQQGLSVAGPAALATSVQRRLLGLAGGAQATEAPDPLLTELRPGRVLCVAEVRNAAPSALPIAVAGAQAGLLSGLLPALAPQAGVALASLRVALEPIPDRRWRLAVLALLERLKHDAGPDEQQALKAKAAGPAFRCRVLLLAVADDEAAGRAQLQTIGDALAATAQACDQQTQRLQADSATVLPAVVTPAPPLPSTWRLAGAGLGSMIAIGMAIMLFRAGAAGTLALFGAALALLTPPLALAATWRWRTRAQQALDHALIVAGALPPRNPRVVPIWWPWLGRAD